MAANEALEACAAVSGAHLEQLPLDSAVPSVLDCLGARELGALSCTGSAVLRRAACTAWRALLQRDFPQAAAAPGSAFHEAARQVKLARALRLRPSCGSAGERSPEALVEALCADLGAGGLAGVLTVHSADVGMQREVLRILALSVATPGERGGSAGQAAAITAADFVAAGGIEAVLAVMSAQLTDAPLQNLGCLALRNLSSLSANGAAIVLAGGIEALLAAMDAHLGDLRVQENALRAAVCITGCSIFEPSAIIMPAYIKAVVAAMAAHTGDEDVQTIASGILFALTPNGPNIASIVAAGGIEAVVAAMAAHTNVENLQLYGCSLLRNIADIDPVKVAIAGAGGIGVVVTAMIVFAAVASVQASASGALSNLACENGSNKVAIAAAGGIEAVVAAMRAHREDAGVQGAACYALRNLACENESNQVAIVAAGGTELVSAAMAAHTHAYLQENGSAIMAMLRHSFPALSLWLGGFY
jgi:hypothetical protein